MLHNNLLRHTVPAFIIFLLHQLLIISCGRAPGDVHQEKSGQAALVFVGENSQLNNRSNAMRSNADEYYPGTDLYLLEPISPQGELRNLTKQYTRAGQNREDRYGHACDPEVSFDGKKILFSILLVNISTIIWIITYAAIIA